MLLSVLRWCFSFVDSLFIIAPIEGLCVWSLLSYAIICVLSSFANILMRKRESWLLYFNCIPDVVPLLLACVSSRMLVCATSECVIVVLPNHSQLL